MQLCLHFPSARSNCLPLPIAHSLRYQLQKDDGTLGEMIWKENRLVGLIRQGNGDCITALLRHSIDVQYHSTCRAYDGW